MITMATNEPAEVQSGTDCTIELPLGLLGFEPIKKYRLVQHPEEAPFMWLEMTDDPRQAFVVVNPAEVVSDYRPNISPEDVEFLGLTGTDDAWVLNIVTLRGDAHPTVNLKGPIVLNRRSRIAKQVIPINAASFPLQHPLPAVG